MAVKYAKLFHSKAYQNCDFWYENIQSGNPGQTCFRFLSEKNRVSLVQRSNIAAERPSKYRSLKCQLPIFFSLRKSHSAKFQLEIIFFPLRTAT
jgi:hypothetical protein